MGSRARDCILLLLVLFLPPGAVAQSVYGSLKGALTLNSGVPVPQALVVVSALDKGDLVKFSAQTDNSGFFYFSNVPPGSYKMRMQKDGFKTHEEPIVPVSADTTSEVNVKLTQGDPGDKEVGDGSAVSILKVDRADVSTRFSSRDIDSLPAFRQNISQYELLVPGSVRTIAVLSTQQNPQGGVYASLSGQHFSGTTVIVDGTVNRDPLQGIVVLNPSLDSVSELKVTTQNYSAEFGPATGGVVSVQTRSGTNQLHGSTFGYWLPDFTQATLPDFGQTSTLQSSSDKRADFGGSLGGPLVRNRLFLFGDYRGVRRTSDGSVLLTVPTEKVHVSCTGVASSTSPCDLTEYKDAGMKFASKYSAGTISNSSVSPEMAMFLKMVPLPNHGSGVTNNFIASGVDAFDNDNFDVRADYFVSTKLSTFGRYSFADFRENGSPAFSTAGGAGTNPAQFAGTLQDRNQGISAGFSLKVTPRLLTDFRFGFFRYNLRLDSLDAGTTPATNAGVAGLNLPGDVYSSGMPDIQLDANPGVPVASGNFLRLGYSPVVNSCNCPLREREQQFQFVDNWTKLLGKHEIRWGADVRYLQNFRLSSDARRAGHLEFSTGATGNSLGDFLVGAVGFFERAYNNPTNPAANSAGERQIRMFFYGEDTWRVNARLSVNYGLRWEIYLPQSVTGNDAGGWLQLGSGASPVDDQFLVAGRAGTNLKGGVQTTLKNFGPRLGIAYLVNPKTVIRAGYGRTFDPGYSGTIFGIAATQSPPVGLVTTVQNGFTINSNVDAQQIVPIDVCTMGGPCAVPSFTFPPAPFTINDLYTENLIHTPNPKLLPDQVQQGNLYALPRRLRLPTVDAWNVAVQHALDRHTYFEISYVANKGTHVFNDNTSQLPYYDLNQPTLEGFLGPVAGIPNHCLGAPAKGAMFCKTTQISRQPFQPWTAQIRYFGNNASSNYDSLQGKVRRQFTSGFSVLGSYTWSKIRDFDNGYYPIDPRVSRGVGNFDRKHNFVMTNVWDLPVGRGRALLGEAGPVLSRIVGGWSLAAITLWSSGLPFTPSYSECAPDIGSFQFIPCRPNLVGNVRITGSRSQYFTTTNGTSLQATCAPPVTPVVELCPTNTSNQQQGFDPESGQPLLGQTIGPWQRPGAGQIGNAGRNPLRGPGFFQGDLAVAKNIPITERVALQFRTDFFNLFNTVNLGNPATSVDAPSGAAQITTRGIGAIQRQIQFSLRVIF